MKSLITLLMLNLFLHFILADTKNPKQPVMLYRVKRDTIGPVNTGVQQLVGGVVPIDQLLPPQDPNAKPSLTIVVQNIFDMIAAAVPGSDPTLQQVLTTISPVLDGLNSTLDADTTKPIVLYLQSLTSGTSSMPSTTPSTAPNSTSMPSTPSQPSTASNSTYTPSTPSQQPSPNTYNM